MKKRKKIVKKRTRGKHPSKNAIMQGIEKRLIGTAMIFDEEANVLLGKERGIPAAGNPHYTVSERLAEMRDKGSNFACVVCKMITWVARHILGSKSKDHCKSAMTKMPWSIPTDG